MAIIDKKLHNDFIYQEDSHKKSKNHQISSCDANSIIILENNKNAEMSAKQVLNANIESKSSIREDYLYYRDFYNANSASENFINELKNNSIVKDLQESATIKLGDEISKDTAKNFYNKGYADILVKGSNEKEEVLKGWHSLETQREISREVIKDKKTGKEKEVVKSNKFELTSFEDKLKELEKTLGPVSNFKFYASNPDNNKTSFNTEIDDSEITKKGVAYKVFKLIDGKLYPPMVQNTTSGKDGEKIIGADTPIGKWIECGAEEFQFITSNSGKAQVISRKPNQKSSKSTLSYRPGWHLGGEPYAPQFASKEDNIRWANQNQNCVWAECEYTADVEYQDRAMSYGYSKDGNFLHSMAGLPYRPKNGYYKYRTNPDPNTVPWIITGAMKVNKILSDEEVMKLCQKNNCPYMKKVFKPLTVNEMYRLFTSKFNSLCNSETDEKATERIKNYIESALTENLSEEKLNKVYDSQNNELSDSQVEFFKNSKIRDDKGRLLVLFHGSYNNFECFDSSKAYSTDGFYFSNSKSVASHFGGTNRIVNKEKELKKVKSTSDVNTLMKMYSKYINYNVHVERFGNNYYLVTDEMGNGELIGEEKIDDNIYYLYLSNEAKWRANKDYITFIEEVDSSEEDKKFGITSKNKYKVDFVKMLKEKIEDKLQTYKQIFNLSNGYTYVCYLNCSNPYIIDAKKHPYHDVEFEGKTYNVSTIASIIKQRGYDCLIVKNVYETDYENILCTDYVVFDTKKIKSIYNDTPTSSNNINESFDNTLKKIYSELIEQWSLRFIELERECLEDADDEEWYKEYYTESLKNAQNFNEFFKSNDVYWIGYDETSNKNSDGYKFASFIKSLCIYAEDNFGVSISPEELYSIGEEKLINDVYNYVFANIEIPSKYIKESQLSESYNADEEINKYFDNLVDKICNLSDAEFFDKLKKSAEGGSAKSYKGNEGFGSAYLLPDGTFVFGDTHEQLRSALLFKEVNSDIKSMNDEQYSACQSCAEDCACNNTKYTKRFTQSGLIRIGYWDENIEFYKRPTQIQIDKLVDYLYMLISAGNEKIEIDVILNRCLYKTYSFKNNLPEEIIKKVLRAFSSGELVESADLSENKHIDTNNSIPEFVYHNTSEEFDKFKDDAMYFFGDNAEDVTDIFGEEYTLKCHLNVSKPFIFDANGQVWSNIQLCEIYEGNDVILKEDSKGKFASDWCGEDMNVAIYSTEDIVEFIKQLHPEYDCVIIKNVCEGIGIEQKIITDYVVWDSNKITIFDTIVNDI